MHDGCKGECTVSTTKTYNRTYFQDNLKLSVTNFPIQACPQCDFYEMNLSDGVMVDLFAKKLGPAGKVQVDFSKIAQEYSGKDITEELLKMKEH